MPGPKPVLHETQPVLSITANQDLAGPSWVVKALVGGNVEVRFFDDLRAVREWVTRWAAPPGHSTVDVPRETIRRQYRVFKPEHIADGDSPDDVDYVLVPKSRHP